jgi:TadE-like protein
MGTPSSRRFQPGIGRERGAEIVEAALVLPIALAIILGLFAFGRGWDVYQTMTRAAREGVREAVLTDCATCTSGTDCYSADCIQQNIVFPALQTVGIDTTNPVFTSSYTQGYRWIDSSGQICGAYIAFQYPYRITIPFLPVNLGTVNLNTNVQMQLENPTTDGSCPP